MKLMFVHGRAQQHKVSATLRGEWERALRAGLQTVGLPWPSDIDIRFPFYGDALDEMVSQVRATPPDSAGVRGGSAANAELEFRAEFLREVADKNGITEDAINREFQGPAHERGVLNWPWVQAILRALDRTPLGSNAIDAFTRDVFVYLHYRAVQQRIDAIVANDLGPGPTVVVAHSLGSVVAYNVLRHQADAGVRKYVTVGCPLGVRAIQTRLESPLAMPSCTSEWFNGRDHRDVVALYPLDAANFAIQPPIVNFDEVNNLTGNRHGIDGYLSDPRVAREIQEVLATS